MYRIIIEDTIINIVFLNTKKLACLYPDRNIFCKKTNYKKVEDKN